MAVRSFVFSKGDVLSVVTTRISLVVFLAVVLAGSALAFAGQSRAEEGSSNGKFVVLYDEGASQGAARAAVKAAGGRVVEENTAVGLATVRAGGGFVDAVADSDAIYGAAEDRSIGKAPADRRKKNRDLERLTAERQKAQAGKPAKPGKPGKKDEPLADLQWDMKAIDADSDGSQRVQPGDKKVRVGVIDTGIDGSHPDIAPNFNAGLSRNFTTDDPIIDGPCDEDPDGSCTDPADVDEDGHGTHVAGTIASPVNKQGIAGVAPRTELVNLRAGQDSGYFFLQPTVDALTYAGDNGIDVVNMSFYIDPWLYNCTNNPADSPEAQEQQRTIIEATQRALDYAHDRGVTLVAALGNGHTDLGNPTFDDSSPDYPPDSSYPRTVDNGCLNLPTEGHNVISVSSTGPSGMKADYSDYGTEQADVAAPGGYYRDNFGTPDYKTPGNLILAPYPESLARANGELNEDGTPNTPFVVRDCRTKDKHCSYYQYLQGTSMASPHAAGVAALIVAEYGTKDKVHGGLTLDPAETERRLYASATDTPCPTPPTVVYPERTYTATCEGTPDDNGFYGEGIVNALDAVGGAKKY